LAWNLENELFKRHVSKLAFVLGYVGLCVSITIASVDGRRFLVLLFPLALLLLNKLRNTWELGELIENYHESCENKMRTFGNTKIQNAIPLPPYPLLSAG
jgi:hypothetical protein